MKICMCGKCAAKMEENKPMEKTRKDTCQVCGKRRYCAPYDVKIKEK